MTSGLRSWTSRMMRPMMGYVPLFLAPPAMLKCSSLSFWVCGVARGRVSRSSRAMAVGSESRDSKQSHLNMMLELQSTATMT
ncbi:hypothetical protein QBC37DRAFT_429732, partial [Rhypophila decipiens]